MTKQIKRLAAVLIAGAMILTMAASVSANNSTPCWNPECGGTIGGEPEWSICESSGSCLSIIPCSNRCGNGNSAGSCQERGGFTWLDEWISRARDGMGEDGRILCHQIGECGICDRRIDRPLAEGTCGKCIECGGDGGSGGSADGGNTPTPDTAPNVVLESFPTWKGTGSATVRIDLDHEDFEGLFLDGNAVDTANYTVTAGSTVITLNEDYLKSLGNGTHNFTATFAGGEVVNIPLTVNVASGGSGSGIDSNPKTGVALVVIPTMIAGGAMLIARSARKRK